MKAIFTCDDVFDILTREPFPSGGTEDEFVESHLAVCHECRQLAEAFRPAVGLFHESLSTDVNDELPMYAGRLKPIIDALEPPKPLATPPTRSAFTTMALVIAAGIMLVGSVAFAVLANQQRTNELTPLASQVRYHENRDYTLLAALEIPATCRSISAASEKAATADIACCTQCHKAGSRVTSTDKAIVKSAAACVACHDGMSNEAISAASLWRGPSFDYDRLRMRFEQEFEQINSRLVIACAATRPRTSALDGGRTMVDKRLVASLDGRLHSSERRDFEVRLEQWTRRMHRQSPNSRQLRPEYLHVATCEADRLC